MTPSPDLTSTPPPVRLPKRWTLPSRPARVHLRLRSTPREPRCTSRTSARITYRLTRSTPARAPPPCSKLLLSRPAPGPSQQRWMRRGHSSTFAISLRKTSPSFKSIRTPADFPAARSPLPHRWHRRSWYWPNKNNFKKSRASRPRPHTVLLDLLWNSRLRSACGQTADAGLCSGAQLPCNRAFPSQLGESARVGPAVQHPAGL